ncbi:unnamed protein product [Sphagnum jensenii]|uniref:protein disulfide-isomerase n=1 Tax=Sphagnum jensenii TaxID=128206 RepID=A0ABP0WQZ5_9BRYO
MASFLRRLSSSFPVFLVVFFLSTSFFVIRECVSDEIDGSGSSSSSSSGDDGGGVSESVFVDDKDVFVLGDANFTEFVTTNPYVLVEFYAPWCGYCMSLAPEWASAASILKGDVPLAKVDATIHAELAQKFGVQSYPTILFFIDGIPKPYTGERESDGIVMWVKKKTGPAIDFIKSSTDAQELLEQDTPVAVAFLQDFEGKDAKELTAAARQEDGIWFYVTGDADIAKIFGLSNKAPALVLLKKQNEKRSTFDGVFERNEISEFLSANKLPLVVTFNRETALAIFEDDAYQQIFLFALPEEFEKIHGNFEEAAKSFKRKIIFVLVDLAEKEDATPVLDFFGIISDETKLMGLSVGTGRKFLYSGDYSVDSIKVFGEKFLAGELLPYLKSESIPEKNDGNVKIVVSDTFHDIVLDETKDVLLEVYAPWCGHCRDMEPEYNHLAEVLRDIPSIVIAKMDGTKNEHSLVEIEGFPSILFFPAGEKSKKPLAVDTERTATAFLKYIKKNAGIPFTAPEIPEVNFEDGLDLDLVNEADQEIEPDQHIKDEL